MSEEVSFWFSLYRHSKQGGDYDSGYIQPLAFFGDGPRVPLLVVSPYTRPRRCCLIENRGRNGRRGAIHCALWDGSPPQAGAMNCAPTPTRFSCMFLLIFV